MQFFSAVAVLLDDGKTLDFENLLIATGSMPLLPAIDGADLPGVFPLWTLGQTEQVLQAAVALEQPRVVMIGAGFVGFLVLGAMYKRGWQLTVVERESRDPPGF